MKLMRFAVLVVVTMLSTNINGQHLQKDNMTNSEIVKKFLNGFNNPAEIQASLDLLAEDYQFKNPMVALNSKAEFIGLAQEIGAVITGIEIINISENGDWVATFYDFQSSIPGLESNTASEWFRLENGMIKESQLIYDTSGWRKVYEQMNDK